MAELWTKERVEEHVKEWCEEIRDEFKPDAHNRSKCETDRDKIIEWVEENHDQSYWGQICTPGRLTDWNLDDMLRDVKDNSLPSILALSEDWGCTETDSGLWEGCSPWAAIGIVGFYSLRNLIWECLREQFGININDDQPFKPEWWDKVCDMDRKTLRAVLELTDEDDFEASDDDLRQQIIDGIAKEEIDPDLDLDPEVEEDSGRCPACGQPLQDDVCQNPDCDS